MIQKSVSMKSCEETWRQTHSLSAEKCKAALAWLSSRGQQRLAGGGTAFSVICKRQEAPWPAAIRNSQLCSLLYLCPFFSHLEKPLLSLHLQDALLKQNGSSTASNAVTHQLLAKNHKNQKSTLWCCNQRSITFQAGHLPPNNPFILFHRKSKNIGY